MELCQIDLAVSPHAFLMSKLEAAGIPLKTEYGYTSVADGVLHKNKCPMTDAITYTWVPSFKT